MRHYVSSIARAKSLAHDLTSLAHEIANRRISYTSAQHAVALAIGYSDWTELKTNLIKENHRLLTSLDETLEPEFLRERLRKQAGVLVETLQLEKEHAALIVAHLRISAHPAGPHRMEGPCSSFDVRGTPREYRGTHADGRPIVIVAGCERSLSLAAVAIGHGRNGKEVPAIVLNAGPNAAEVRLRSGLVDSIRHRETSVPRHLEVPADLVDDTDRWISLEASEPPISAGPDLTVLEDEDYIGVIARERWDNFDMRVIRVRIAKAVDEGHLEATATYTRADTPEAVFKARRLEAGERRFGMRSPNLDLLDCLIRCGLVENCGESRHLGFYLPPRERRGTGPAGSLLDEERERHWKAIVAHTDLAKVVRYLDMDALTLLCDLDPHLLYDGTIYNRVRATKENLLIRECLTRLPVLFPSILLSPELLNLPSFASVSNALTHDGASCAEGTVSGPIKPIPIHVMEWMTDRAIRFHRRGSDFANSCVAALSALPSDQMPRTDREWQALQVLVRELGDAVDSPVAILGVEAVLKFMKADVRVPRRRTLDDMSLFRKVPSQPGIFRDLAG